MKLLAALVIPAASVLAALGALEQGAAHAAAVLAGALAVCWFLVWR